MIVLGSSDMVRVAGAESQARREGELDATNWTEADEADCGHQKDILRRGLIDARDKERGETGELTRSYGEPTWRRRGSHYCARTSWTIYTLSMQSKRRRQRVKKDLSCGRRLTETTTGSELERGRCESWSCHSACLGWSARHHRWSNWGGRLASRHKDKACPHSTVWIGCLGR